MPLLTRSASKKQKLDPSLEERQNPEKVPQRRKEMRLRQDAQEPATVSVDARAHQRLKPRLRVDARGSTEVEALPTKTALPLTSATPPTPIASAVMPLKGHKRFNADLRELIARCSSDLDNGIWSVQSKFTIASIISLINSDFLEFRVGEDDGSVEFELMNSKDKAIIVVHLLCSGKS